MRNPLKTSGRLLCACVLGVAAATASMHASADINRQQAANIAKGNGGKVLKVTPVNHKGRKAFRVKVLTAADKVIYVVVDGQSGRVINRR
ncbi:PepSY domain-containing protein [bacterium SCSIO 12696]|nr:PepSY domain-containing protein [bacterium SCSIO 12696]